MAQAMKCDRCGQYYEPYNILNFKEEFNCLRTMQKGETISTKLIENYDLCPECNHSFINWLNEIKTVKAIVNEVNITKEEGEEE